MRIPVLKYPTSKHAAHFEKAAHCGRVESGFKGTNRRLVIRLAEDLSRKLGRKTLQPIFSTDNKEVFGATPIFTNDKSLVLIKDNQIRIFDLDAKRIFYKPFIIPPETNTQHYSAIADQSQGRIFIVSGGSNLDPNSNKDVKLAEYSLADGPINETNLEYQGETVQGLVYKLHIDKDHNLHIIVDDLKKDPCYSHYKLTSNRELELVAQYKGAVSGFVFIDDKLYHYKVPFLDGDFKLLDAEQPENIRKSIPLPRLSRRDSIPLKDFTSSDMPLLIEIVNDNKGRLYCHCTAGIYVFKRNPIGTYQYEFNLPIYDDFMNSKLAVDMNGNLILSHHPRLYGDASVLINAINPVTKFYYIPHDEIAQYAKTPRLQILTEMELSLARQQSLDPERTQLPSYRELDSSSRDYKAIASSVNERVRNHGLADTGLKPSKLIPETRFYYNQGDEPACYSNACLNALEQLGLRPSYAQMSKIYKMNLARMIFHDFIACRAGAKQFKADESFKLVELLPELFPKIQIAALSLEEFANREHRKCESTIQSNARLIKECLDRGEKLLISVNNKVFNLNSNSNSYHVVVITGYEINSAGQMDLMIVDSRLGPIKCSLEHLSNALPPRETYKYKRRIGAEWHHRVGLS